MRGRVDCKAYWRKGRQTRGCRALISGGGAGGAGGREVMILRVKKGQWMDVERQGGKRECRGDEESVKREEITRG